MSDCDNRLTGLLFFPAPPWPPPHLLHPAATVVLLKASLTTSDTLPSSSPIATRPPVPSLHSPVLISLERWVFHNFPSHILSYIFQAEPHLPQISPVWVCLGAFVSCQEESFSSTFNYQNSTSPWNSISDGAYSTGHALTTSFGTNLTLLRTVRGLDLLLLGSLEFYFNHLNSKTQDQSSCFLHLLCRLEHGAWRHLLTVNCVADLRSWKLSIIAFSSFLTGSPHRNLWKDVSSLARQLLEGLCPRPSPQWAHGIYAQDMNGAANSLSLDRASTKLKEEDTCAQGNTKTTNMGMLLWTSFSWITNIFNLITLPYKEQRRKWGMKTIF